jgi:hypothetical protein
MPQGLSAGVVWQDYHQQLGYSGGMHCSGRFRADLSLLGLCAGLVWNTRIPENRKWLFIRTGKNCSLFFVSALFWLWGKSFFLLAWVSSEIRQPTWAPANSAG